MMGNPIEIHGEYLSLELLPPLKGEPTTEILKELGYDSSEIQASIAQDSFIT